MGRPLQHRPASSGPAIWQALLTRHRYRATFLRLYGAALYAGIPDDPCGSPAIRMKTFPTLSTVRGPTPPRRQRAQTFWEFVQIRQNEEVF